MNLRDSQASLALDLTRAMAAQAVCVGHAISTFEVLTWAQPPHVPYMQNVAVLIFFLVSGFVIAHSLSGTATFRDYLINRFARIYSALVPCLLVIALLDFAFGTSRRTNTVQDFMGSLVMLNDIFGPLGKLEFHSFGTAGQLWTLAIEWHLYIFAGALFFARRKLRLCLFAIPSGLIALPYLKNIPDVDFAHGVSLLWFLGFVSYFALRWVRGAPTWLLAAAGVASLGMYFGYVNPTAEFHRSSYGMLAFAFFCAIAVAARFRANSGITVRVVRVIADYSFTLYLVHNSIVKGLYHFSSEPWLAVAAIIGANLVVLAIAMPTEMRHREFASVIRRFLQGQRLQPSLQAAGR